MRCPFEFRARNSGRPALPLLRCAYPMIVMEWIYGKTWYCPACSFQLEIPESQQSLNQYTRKS